MTDAQNRRIEDKRAAGSLEWDGQATGSQTAFARAARENTRLANAFAEAGRNFLDRLGTGAAMAVIPETQPLVYVIAGTLPIIAQVLPKDEGATAAPSAASIEGLTRYWWTREGMETVEDKEYADTGFYVAADVERLLVTQSAKQGARPEAEALVAEARAVFDLMVDGCRDPQFGDFQNGHGETIGPRMDALHAKLRAFPAQAAPEQVAQVQADVRDQALDEAAKVAIKFTAVPRDVLGAPTSNMKAYASTGEKIAAAIRKMKSKRAASTDGEARDA